MMTIKFWGTRGSIASPGKKTIKYGGNTSCVELRTGKHILIFDAGTGIRDLGTKLLQEFGDKPAVLHLFISHTHWDHIQGFPFFMPAYKNNFHIFLYGPPAHNRTMKDLMKSQMDPEYFPVPLGDLSAAIEVKDVCEPFQIDELVITPFPVNHPTITYAYKVTLGSKSIIYASDNEPYRYTTHAVRKDAVEGKTGEELDNEFIGFISKANLLMCEAQYTMDEYKTKIGWGHSPVELVAEFSAKANVHKLAILHHDPAHDDAVIDGMIKKARNLLAKQKKKIECIGAQEGMVLKI